MVRFRSEKDQMLVGRDVFVVAFFSEHLYAQTATAVEKVFDAWLQRLPEGVLEWALVGASASTFKRFTSAMIQRSRAELQPDKAAKKADGFFQLVGGEDKFNPSYAFTFFGTNETAGKFPDRTCLVEMRWPSDHAEQVGFDEMADFVRKVAEALPYRSGYASPALSRGWEDSQHVREGARHIVPLAFRYPGYDLPENQATAFFMGKVQCRGARWLTLLGPGLLNALGGRRTLQGKLAPEVQVLDAGEGVMIRAGERPEFGDVNRGESTPLLRSVAAAIEPVTYFNDWRSLGNLFERDKEQVLRWERRHLD